MDEYVVVIRVDPAFAAANDAVIEQLCERIDGSPLGEVSARMSMGGLDYVIWIDVCADNENQVERIVVPALRLLLDELELSAVARVEIPPDADDDDEDDGWVAGDEDDDDDDDE